MSAGSFCTSCLPNQVVSNNACVTPAASQCGGAPTVTVNGYVMCCPAGDSASSTQCANNPYTTDNPAGCEQVLIDNRSQAGRTRPGGGCVAGYVWREANATDHVCVPPSTRTQTITDNERWQRGQIAPQKPSETRTNPPPSCRDGHCTTKRSTPSRQKRYIFRRGRSTASPTNRKR